MPEPRSLEQQDQLGNSWPSMVAPVVNPVGGGIISTLLGLPLSLSGTCIVDGPDTTGQTEWQIRTGANGSGSLVWTNLVTNPLLLLAVTVPALTLPIGQTLYVRARMTCTTLLGTSPWSADVAFNT